MLEKSSGSGRSRRSRSGRPEGRDWDSVALPVFGERGAPENVYALRVDGDSMQPLYRKGDILIVAPGGKIRRGDRVVVRTRGGEVMVKEVAKINAQHTILQSLNRDYDEAMLENGDMQWMARVFWVSQ